MTQKPNDAQLARAMIYGWVGPVPLSFRGEIIDGRRRMHFAKANGRPHPAPLEVISEADAVRELAQRSEYRRAVALLDKSPHAGADTAGLVILTGLPKQRAARIVQARGPVRRTHTKPRPSKVVARLRQLLEAHELEGQPITPDDLRAALLEVGG